MSSIPEQGQLLFLGWAVSMSLASRRRSENARRVGGLFQLLRIIGDVHGQVDFVLRDRARTYFELIADCANSVQLGDMGDAETYAALVANVDSNRHQFFGGNHDHYPHLPPHAMGDFGFSELGGVSFFFVRGAESSDKAKLVERGKSLGKQLWFEDEELPESLHDHIASMYEAAKPEIMLTHTCPESIDPLIQKHVCSRRRHPSTPVYSSSPTSRLLERLLDLHRPKRWCFGHYHHDWRYLDRGVEFNCIGELSWLDV